MARCTPSRCARRTARSSRVSRETRGRSARPSPTDPAKLIVTTSHPARYTRTVAVYVPAQYVPGTVAPFIVGADGPDTLLFTALDNLIAQKRVPPMIAISIGNGSGDAQGSQRGLEYDTMSGRYAEFVETEVLPLRRAAVRRAPNEGSRRARDDGWKLGRLRRVHHGVVSPGARITACSPTRSRRQPAVAARAPRRRTARGSCTSGSSRTARSSRFASGWRSVTGTCSTRT